MTINNKSERNSRGKCLGWPVTSYGADYLLFFYFTVIPWFVSFQKIGDPIDLIPLFIARTTSTSHMPNAEETAFRFALLSLLFRAKTRYKYTLCRLF